MAITEQQRIDAQGAIENANQAVKIAGGVSADVTARNEALAKSNAALATIPRGPELDPSVPVRAPRTAQTELDVLRDEIARGRVSAETSSEAKRKAIADALEANLASIEGQTQQQIGEINKQEFETRGQTRGVNVKSGLVGSTFAEAAQGRVKDVAQSKRTAVGEMAATKRSILVGNSAKSFAEVEDIYNAQLQSLRQEELGVVERGLAISEAEQAKTADRIKNIAASGQYDLETFSMLTFEDGTSMRDVVASQLSGKDISLINDVDRLYVDSIFKNNLPKDLQTEFIEKFLPNEDGTATLYRSRVGVDGKIEELSYKLELPYSKVSGSGKWGTLTDGSGQVYIMPEIIDPIKSLDEQLTKIGGPKPVETIGGGGTVTGNIERDAESIMSGELNLNDVSTAKNYRSLVAAELRKKAEEAKDKGDIYGTMKASAAYDKEVSDTFLQSMEKTISVLGQLGILQENIANVKTGPIVGTFKSKNPWDTEAQTIKAQLNAIVPNLARGVYGEVGVLTDNDIRTYSKTIPNLSSTEEVRNAILYITVDMIRRNIETKIKNQAAGQRDMSGYADIYKQVVDTAEQILQTIPRAGIASSNVLTSPNGSQQVDISELTEEQIQEAKDAGWQ